MACGLGEIEIMTTLATRDAFGFQEFEDRYAG